MVWSAVQKQTNHKMKKVLRLLALLGLLLGVGIGSSAADMGSAFERNDSTPVRRGKVTFDRAIDGNKFVVIKAGSATYVHYTLTLDTALGSLDPVSNGTSVTLRKGTRRTIFFIPAEFPDNREKTVEWVEYDEKEFKSLLEGLKP